MEQLGQMVELQSPVLVEHSLPHRVGLFFPNRLRANLD